MTEFQAVTADICEEIQQRMRELLAAQDQVVDPILEHILATPGKCVRPLFMRLVAEHAGGTWDDVKDAAVAVEAIHLASLMHDDVVDEADLRRGDPTVNASHSDKVSVLFGDYIFITALKSATTMDRAEVVGILFDAVRRMVSGEISDTIANGKIDESHYFRIIADKTASLFAAAGELAILLSGGNESERSWGAQVGELVGKAFQIVDDTLDYTGASERMGKPACSDLIAGTVTLPLIYALRDAGEIERQQILTGEQQSIEERCAFVRAKGGVSYALGYAGNLLGEARTLIGNSGNDASRQALERYFMMIHAREM